MPDLIIMEILKSVIFEDIMVSGINASFSEDKLEGVPHQFYVDWVSLLVKVTKLKFPEFEIPAFPESFEFEESIYHSSVSSEDYYTNDYYNFGLKGDNGFGIDIEAYIGHQPQVNVIDSIEITPVGLPDDSEKLYSTLISSRINLTSGSPLATFFIGVEGDEQAQIEKIFDDHKKYCLSPILTTQD